MKNQEKLEKIRDFLAKLHANIETRKKEIATQNESQSSSTMIPFYDLFYDQIKDLMREESQMELSSATMTSVAGQLPNNGVNFLKTRGE